MEWNLLREDINTLKNLKVKPNFSALARKYDVDRHTVKKYWDNENLNKKRGPRKSYYDEFHDEISDMIIIKQMSISKVHKTLIKKYESRGFNGTYSALLYYVRARKIVEKDPD